MSVAGGSIRGNRGKRPLQPSPRTNRHFDCWIAARIEDFADSYVRNRGGVHLIHLQIRGTGKVSQVLDCGVRSSNIE